MSLDVYLKSGKQIHKCTCANCGNEHDCEEDKILFEANITHNLNKMAEAAGIYKHLWRPEEMGITKASELIGPLTSAIIDMKNREEYYSQFNASNGWGTYKDFLPWVKQYRDACIENPDANIEASR